MSVPFVDRNFIQRMLGICATPKPVDPGCWSYGNGRLTIDLSRAVELSQKGGALRVEGGTVPKRVLVVHGHDGRFRAFENRCTHLGHRRLDPVPGHDLVQCCSVNKSTYDTDGKKVHGPVPKPVPMFAVEEKDGALVVALG